MNSDGEGRELWSKSEINEMDSLCLSLVHVSLR
jgi:hypothetical protein